MKVLIADDEFNVRDVIRYIGKWDEHGITELLEAANGNEAKKVIEKEQPEIIFTDIKMPGMSGLELIEWLDSISYEGKVVLITGYDDYQFMRKAIQHNSFDYLLKPVEDEAFNNVLKKAVAAYDEESKSRLYQEDAVKIRWSQTMLAACLGEPADLDFIASNLPPSEKYDLTLLTFYQMHQPAPFIEKLADQLVEQEIGNAVMLSGDSNQSVLITLPEEWLFVEERLSRELDIPVRLVKGELQSLHEIHEKYNDLQSEMENQNYRSIQRLDELEAKQRMNDIISYVETYYMEDMSLERLANGFFFSREHISRKFKQETGLTLSKYITKLRIDQAKRWLKESDESIFSISTMLGYQDEKYFSKLFKKEVGITPFEYRNG
ncbi:response regulator [Bacillus sp. E(2018)]|uniref:response regulator n=1 Tax=Bacillus sp. E(2018) TaxID=2502239 RepID=UPI0010F6A9D0|nr:response regulator [Bacillus sp. E(2018)]